MKADGKSAKGHKYKSAKGAKGNSAEGNVGERSEGQSSRETIITYLKVVSGGVLIGKSKETTKPKNPKNHFRVMGSG